MILNLKRVRSFIRRKGTKLKRKILRRRKILSKILEIVLFYSNFYLRLTLIEKEQIRCKMEVASSDLIQQENERLISKLQEIITHNHREMELRTEEINERRKHAFSTEISMDQVFRKTLVKIDEEYKQRAVSIV